MKVIRGCEKSSNRKEDYSSEGLGVVGAGDGIRTRDINLGKVALYQLSYSREEG
jgi:hypothetical protein